MLFRKGRIKKQVFFCLVGVKTTHYSQWYYAFKYKCTAYVLYTFFICFSLMGWRIKFVKYNYFNHCFRNIYFMCFIINNTSRFNLFTKPRRSTCILILLDKIYLTFVWTPHLTSRAKNHQRVSMVFSENRDNLCRLTRK